jgi:hypothetical protein
MICFFIELCCSKCLLLPEFMGYCTQTVQIQTNTVLEDSQQRYLFMMCVREIVSPAVQCTNACVYIDLCQMVINEIDVL